MMNKVKYIVFDSGDVVIFSATIDHSTMRNTGRGNPAGAGFLHFFISDTVEGGKRNAHVSVMCYGESVSLKLKSREKLDEEKVNQYVLNNHLR